MGGPRHEQAPASANRLVTLSHDLVGALDQRPELEVRLRTTAGDTRHVLFNAVYAPDERLLYISGKDVTAMAERRVFGMFQRLHTRDQFEGTGIGLAIARKVVERHGGGIAAAPREEGGSRFTFTLPGGGA